MNRVHIGRTPIMFAVLMALALAAVTLAAMFYPVEAQDGSVPAKPTGLSATAAHDQVVLTWDVTGDDTVTGYVILRRNIATQESGEFTTVSANTGTADGIYTDGSVATETRYAYRIKAINDHGNSPSSDFVKVETGAAPESTVPTKPTGLSATATHDQVALTWDDPQDDSITGYVILRRNRNTDAKGEFTELVSDTGSADTSYTDDTVAAETPYTYRIKAINEHEVSERSRWAHVETTPAPTPEETPNEGTPEQSVSEGDTDLPNDNSTPGRVVVGDSATGTIGTAGDQDRFAVEMLAGHAYQFDLMGSPGGGGTLPDTFFRAIYNSAGQYQADSYDDDFEGGRDSRVTFTPTKSGTYYARVSGDRNETGTYTLSVTDVTPEPEPPSKPTGVVGAASHDTVTLAWDDPQDDSITGYRILRRDQDNNPDGDFATMVADTGSVETSYTDTTVAAERSYTYRVHAISAHGTSPPSHDSPVQTPAAPIDEPAAEPAPAQANGSDPVGTITLTAASPFSARQPYATVQLSAALSGEDQINNLRWQWSRSKVTYTYNESSASWQNIPGANSSSYTPTENDESRYLRATASYKQTFTDGTVDRTAHGVTGDYTRVDISEPPGVDFDYDQDSPGRLRVGKWVTGAMSNETGRDGDAFAVDLERGRKYRIDLEGSQTGRGSLADPFLRSVIYFVGSTWIIAPVSDNDSGRGKNAQVTFTAPATTTHYIVVQGVANTKGTYRLTVQEIVDDLGVWYTDWGAEELGGFLHPYHPGKGKLYNKWIIQRKGGSRDVDGFLFYLGSDEAPLDNSDYILTVRGQKTPRLLVQTFYDLSDLDAYIEHFGLDHDFIEFPRREGAHPDDPNHPDYPRSDAELGRISPVAPRPVGTVLGTSQEGEYHLVFNPGTEDVGAYLATIRSHQKYDTGRYEIALRRHTSMSEPDGEDFGALDWYTKGYVRVDESVTGNIEHEGADTDVFATLLQADRTYLIEAKGSETGDGTLEDPGIAGLSLAKPGSLGTGFANATEFACPTRADCGDDDSGTGLNARIVYSPSQTNLFYIEVANSKAILFEDPFGTSEEGTYTLSVTDVTGQPGY